MVEADVGDDLCLEPGDLAVALVRGLEVDLLLASVAARLR